MTHMSETEALPPVTVEIDGRAYPVLEEARHVILAMPDGSAVVYRAGPLCERCKTCGCGEQAEPFPVPAFIVAAVTGQGDGVKIPGPVRALLGKVMGNGSVS